MRKYNAKISYKRRYWFAQELKKEGEEAKRMNELTSFQTKTNYELFQIGCTVTKLNQFDANDARVTIEVLNGIQLQPNRMQLFPL